MCQYFLGSPSIVHRTNISRTTFTCRNKPMATRICHLMIFFNLRLFFYIHVDVNMLILSLWSDMIHFIDAIADIVHWYAIVSHTREGCLLCTASYLSWLLVAPGHVSHRVCVACQVLSYYRGWHMCISCTWTIYSMALSSYGEHLYNPLRNEGCTFFVKLSTVII